MLSSKISSNLEINSNASISLALSKNILGVLVEFFNLNDLAKLLKVNRKFNTVIKDKAAVKKEDDETTLSSEIFKSLNEFLEERKKLRKIKEAREFFYPSEFYLSYSYILKSKLLKKKFSRCLIDNFYIEIIESLFNQFKVEGKLDLSKDFWELNPVTFKLVTDALKVNQTVTSLDLSGNSLEREIIQQTRISNLKNFGEALKVNQTLTKLYLQGNLLGEFSENLEILADALKVNKTLTTLDLSRNFLGNHELNLKYLGDALRVNTTLTTLYLSTNSLNNAGSSLESFVDVLKHNKSLTLLDLSGNFIPEDKFETIVQELSSVQILI